MAKDIKKYIAELLGTAILVFVACGTAVFSNQLGFVNIVATALAFGLTIVALAYTIGRISGAHVNPAVSLGALINKKISVKDFCFYVIAQFIGAILGGLLLFGIVRLIGLPAAGNMGTNGFVETTRGTGAAIALSLIVEIVLTFIFVFTILGVTMKKANAPMAGMIIGLTLTLVHLIGIGLTGTSVNPARSFGVAIFGGVDALREVWVFLVAPMIGAALAGFAAWYFFKKDDDTVEIEPESEKQKNE